uniref:erythroblast NAD(P)(+)--arginine ADP-ribosyltransferase-like n=1 Tax=Semicossyphus pulcher TaxID=241346 RepID=UPI0037E7D591
MKDNMLIFVPLCLLFGWMLPADTMTIRVNAILRHTVQDVPLSMVEDSVDDMYFGCQDAMMRKVQTNYFKTEIRNEKFFEAWEKTTECAQKEPKREDSALTKYHMHAICVYTDDLIYKEFNDAVRTERGKYGTSFEFHSLHFLLTSAVQILNSNYQCHNTYRRTRSGFAGNVNEIIRFGSFTSSSYDNSLKQFGNETCFKIKTCSGAYLKYYPIYCEAEAEVLIPPYETFKVTEKMIGQGKFKELDDCKVVYLLESAGMKSNLNCKVV